MAVSHANEQIPTYEDVLVAAERIDGKAIRTPLLQSEFLNELSGANVFIKPENLQRTGSFKFRGAYNALSALDVDSRKKGVLAVSSGNHAQGVAEAARLMGISATIIMPADSPEIKLRRTKRSGATVIPYDRLNEDRDKVAEDFLKANPASFIHPYNNPNVIAGQGTAGKELCEDLAAKDIAPDHVLVCTGGGGLTAGIALSVSHHFPEAKVHSCEPEGFDDYRRSLLSGKIETNAQAGGSICDAIVTPSPGVMSFAINKDLLGDGMVVSDAQALKAVAFAFNELKLVVEPGGAVALAALLKEKQTLRGKTVVITLSGGNIDPQILARALAENEE